MGTPFYVSRAKARTAMLKHNGELGVNPILCMLGSVPCACVLVSPLYMPRLCMLFLPQARTCVGTPFCMCLKLTLKKHNSNIVDMLGLKVPCNY